ncbi:hypothetical protein Tco_1234015 [Tanacetum coccineum]
MVVQPTGDTLEEFTRSSEEGTPPQDIIEEMEKTIVSTMSTYKSEIESTTKNRPSNTTTAETKPVPTKRSLLPELSSVAKKNKGN